MFSYLFYSYIYAFRHLFKCLSTAFNLYSLFILFYFSPLSLQLRSALLFRSLLNKVCDAFIWTLPSVFQFSLSLSLFLSICYFPIISESFCETVVRTFVTNEWKNIKFKSLNHFKSLVSLLLSWSQLNIFF